MMIHDKDNVVVLTYKTKRPLYQPVLCIGVCLHTTTTLTLTNKKKKTGHLLFLLFLNNQSKFFPKCNVIIDVGCLDNKQ